MKKILLSLSLLLTLGAATSCAKKSEATASTESNPTSVVAEQAQTAPTSASTAKVHALPQNISGKEALEQIKQSYKGKVVLVDFWATWCPPCVAAMKEVKKIKPELMQKGAVFVYITGETSPETDYNTMVPAIEGEHYRLSDKQWAEVGALLGMRGIPSFMLLGKDGSVLYNNIAEGGYPGNEVLKNQIEVALTK